MASTFTTNLLLELMGTGDQSGAWGGTLNTNVFTYLDSTLGQTESITLGSSNITLTDTQVRRNALNLTGTLTANVTITFPDSRGKTWWIRNATTGAFTVTIKTTSGSGTVVTQGSTRIFWLDNANTFRTFTIDPTTITDISQNISFSGDISPTSIGANQNDYNPSGLSTASTLRLTSSAAYNITGLAGGSDGRLMFIHNIGSFTLTLKNEDAASTAANRFAFTTDLSLIAGAGCVLQYDSTSSRWRCVGIRAPTTTTAIVDYQAFTSTGAGTWTKPAGATANDLVLIMCWGAGGGGGANGGGGGAAGGGGGACTWLLSSAGRWSATESISVGTGGTGSTSVGNGGTGGNSSFSSFTAFGGGGGTGGATPNVGGGGGWQSAGGLGTAGTGYNSGQAFGGGGSGTVPGGAVYGGASGSSPGAAAVNSVMGGGGGGASASTTAGSFSFSLGTQGGTGGAAGGVGGVACGGGGGTSTGGAGGRGEVRVWTFKVG